MYQRTIVRWLAWALLLPSVTSEMETIQLRRSLEGLDRSSDTGDRVSEVDRTGAQCIAGINGSSGSDDVHVPIQYYFAIHSETPVTSDTKNKLEQDLFFLIQSAILWCTQPSIDTEGGRRLAESVDSDLFKKVTAGRRRLTLEDARRMAVLLVSSSPKDAPVADGTFTEEYDPCQFGTEETCEMMLGKMNIIAQESDDVTLMAASIIDAIEALMDYDLLLQPLCLGESTCNIKKIEFWGETVGVVEDNVDEEKGIIAAPASQSKRAPRFLFAAVPLAALTTFAALLARNNRNRRLIVVGGLDNDTDDYILPGTGDPPRSFHEGMYHYTRSGARFLSTNCRDCHETRKMGYFTDGDLATISERHAYDPEGASQQSHSFEDGSMATDDESEFDPSAHRKRNLVEAASGNLGQKSSTVDVHNCASATCRICAYRPADVAFVTSPSNKMFESADDFECRTIV